MSAVLRYENLSASMVRTASRARSPRWANSPPRTRAPSWNTVSAPAGASPLLDNKTREMLIVAAAAAQDLSGEVEIHSRGVLNQGLSPEELIEAIISLTPYIGFPKTNHALAAAKRAIEKNKAEG